MDAKNQQDRAKMVEEAVGRMCRLGMMPQVITKFRKQGTVLKSETVGILYDLNDEEKKAVADWEEESGGICYWCRRAEVKGKYLGEFASEQISRGGVLVLHDSVDGKKRELNKEKLLSGVKQYLENEDKPYNILVDAEDSVGCSKGVYELDCCMVDATVADMIIQYAIFDDIIYG